MKGDGCGQKNEEKPESPVISHKSGAIQQSHPYHCYGKNLDFQRDGFIIHEITNIWS